MGGCTFLYNELVQFLLVFCAEVLERGGCFRGDVQVVHVLLEMVSKVMFWETVVELQVTEV